MPLPVYTACLKDFACQRACGMETDEHYTIAKLRKGPGAKNVQGRSGTPIPSCPCENEWSWDKTITEDDDLVDLEGPSAPAQYRCTIGYPFVARENTYGDRSKCQPRKDQPFNDWGISSITILTYTPGKYGNSETQNRIWRYPAHASIKWTSETGAAARDHDAGVVPKKWLHKPQEGLSWSIRVVLC